MDERQGRKNEVRIGKEMARQMSWVKKGGALGLLIHS